ncbi:MAG TPA: outer membrane beta-barrel protein, partial [Bdellovibrio sp.]|nr:outer membrane beta-barrel protein [Bdellovibrio sp.]
MSYIGLFSYYNFENWAYQASYTSANTPWFFNGLRLQTFPTDRLKVEFWFINGWQSYGMFNESPGVGYQVNYRPTGDWSWVFNGYVGSDTLATPGRTRYHSDNSVQYKYLDTPTKFISKGAFSLTADIGCENGGGVKCSGGDATTPSQYFIGVMAYNRLWFSHDKYAVTMGAGMINNPGRYLVLIPPIQTSQPGASGGASATNPALDSNGNPFFSQNAGDQFHAWDASVTFDYMPEEYITFRAEYIHREADVDYFAGPGGVTSPDGLNTTTKPNTWRPDLEKMENRINLAMMVRF